MINITYFQFILVEGRYLHPLEYYRALVSITAPSLVIHPVFAAYCQPLVTPENAEFLSAGNTNTFRSVHSMDMKCIHVDHMLVWSTPHLKSKE